MKARTTGALTVAALAVALVFVLVFWRAAAVEAVYPVEQAKRAFSQKVLTRVTGLWSGAAAKAENVRLRRANAELALAEK